jgi:hypothetical protein
MWNLHFRNPPSAPEYFPISTHSGGSNILKIWGSQSDVAENSGLLWCYTLTVGDWFLMFWRNILLSSSRVKLSKKTSKYRRKCCDKLVWQYHIVDCKGSKQANQGRCGRGLVVFWSVGNPPQSDTVSHSGRPETWIQYELMYFLLGISPASEY